MMLAPSPIPLRLRYTALEVCFGGVLGPEPWTDPLPPAIDATPREAMEQVVLEALQRPPCLVSFSGGRDSSSVLALAAHVARREGLRLPVPATNRFPAHAETDEDTWQEQVVAHLGLEDWVKLDWTDELDGLGPYAQRVLARHGFAYPYNLHFHDPLMEKARGGSLLTGVGGDEIFGPWLRPHARALVYGRRRPGMRTVPALLRDFAPRRVRVERERARMAVDAPWLRPEVREQLADMRAEQSVGTSLRWGSELDRWWRSRYVQCANASLRGLGADHDVLVRSPFFEQRVFSAWAARAGAVGPPGRTRALRELFEDLVPREVLERETKGSFKPALHGPPSRAFLRSWSGEGLDDRLVVVDELRREWNEERPASSTYMLMRQAWLADATAL